MSSRAPEHLKGERDREVIHITCEASLPPEDNPAAGMR
jgi:hypothetical protein